MVKISIKKDKKPIKAKPKQKQKQKQSQKVIVNIGSNITRAKRRSTGQALQKNVANKQTTTPTPNIIVPQAMSQNSNNEILRYIRESEQQKEMIKKQEKNNELEKDKIKKASVIPIEKKASVIPTEEKAQAQFSVVNSKNISALTSGTATPTYNPLSTPLNYRSLQNELGKLIQRADIEGENPNTGRISLSTNNPNPLLSNQFIGSSKASILTDPSYISDNDSIISYKTKTPLEHSQPPNSLGVFLSTRQIDIDEPVTTQETITTETPQQELVEVQQQPPMETIINEPTQEDAVIIDTPEPEKTVYEEAGEAIKMIDEALKPTKGAEDTGPMIEIKTVDDEPDPNLTRTPQQRKNMREGQVGDVSTAEKVEQPSAQIVAKWR